MSSSDREKDKFPTLKDYSDTESWCVDRKGWWKGFIDSVVIERRCLDRQFPLQLVGTPLAFAVAVGSQDAVELLLSLELAQSLGLVVGNPTLEIRVLVVPFI